MPVVVVMVAVERAQLPWRHADFFPTIFRLHGGDDVPHDLFLLSFPPFSTNLFFSGRGTAPTTATRTDTQRSYFSALSILRLAELLFQLRLSRTWENQNTNNQKGQWRYINGGLGAITDWNGVDFFVIFPLLLCNPVHHLQRLKNLLSLLYIFHPGPLERRRQRQRMSSTIFSHPQPPDQSPTNSLKLFWIPLLYLWIISISIELRKAKRKQKAPTGAVW